MIVETMNIGNVKVRIHDDCIVSDEEVKKTLERISYLAYRQRIAEEKKNGNT